MSNPGPDGYGPPPSREVAEAVAPFFDDDRPFKPDPQKVAEIGKRIEDREANVSWKKRT